jgi:hypothetical protein
VALLSGGGSGHEPFAGGKLRYFIFPYITLVDTMTDRSYENVLRI